jgi:hypothetical protein
LQRAIALEPDRAEYRDMLGRSYLFSLTSYDPKLAAESLQRAVQLNPAVAEYWLDLATAYDSMERKKDSVECVETARRHDPLNPRIAWSTGNIRAEAGDIPAALEAWRQAMEEEPGHIAEGLDLGWKIAPDTQLLLERLVPPDNDSDFAFLNFLTAREMGQPELVWNRLIARGQPFPPKMAAGYFEYLLTKSPEAHQQHNVEIAKKDWAQLLHMIASSSTESGSTESGPDAGADGAESGGARPLETYPNSADNLITNGGFESALLNMGFDWTWDSLPGTVLVLDQTMAQQGRRSARIDFDGTESLIFTGLRQVVPVQPGRHYRLTAYVRAERIKGGAGIRLEVANPRRDQHLPPLAYGQEVFQTTGWVKDSIEFTAPAKTYLVSVQVERDLREAHPTKLSGIFWLDNVVMRESAP